MKKCPFCAEDIQDAAISCKHCGRDLLLAMPAKASGPRWGRILLAVGVLIAIAVWGLLSVADQQRSATTPAAAGDESIDYVAYQRIIVGTGEPCDRVNRTFVAGTDKRTRGIFVSVGCADGHSYRVSGTRTPGSTRVLSCAIRVRQD